MKNLKKIMALSMALVSSMSVFAACGEPNVGDDSTITIDPNKTQVMVGYYDGGLGRDWLNAVIKKYEEINPNVQIIPRWDKKRYDTDKMMANYASYDEDIFLVDLVLNEYETAGMYYDITEVINTPLTEFGESESILDKMSIDLQQAMKSSNDKYYSLPYYEGFYGIYYDIRLFEEKALYMDGNGGWSDGTVKSVGKDGVPNTYDDGLPTTVDEFFTLCDYMLQKGVTPFTWTGVNGYYTTKMLESFWASYEGYENFRLNYTLNSGDQEYKFIDGTSEKITRENAYKLKDGQEGKLAALQFAEAILNGYNGKNGGGKYHSANVWATGQTHMAAQDEYLFSSAIGNPIAFIVEGMYWEREASESFASLYKRTKDSEDKYGNRRFGLMPFPTVHENKGTEAVMASTLSSRVFINKNTDVPEEAKAFFRYLHTSEAMSLMTSLSQSLRPFDYTVAEADKKNLTPLGKTIVETMKSENAIIKLVPDMCVDSVFKNSPFFAYQQWQFGGTFNSGYPIDIMHQRGCTAAEYFATMKINVDDWNSYLK